MIPVYKACSNVKLKKHQRYKYASAKINTLINPSRVLLLVYIYGPEYYNQAGLSTHPPIITA